MKGDSLGSSVAFIREEVLQTQVQEDKKQPKPVSLRQMFRFAQTTDYVIMAIGLLSAVANGAALPLFALLWGNMIDRFKSKADMVDQTWHMLLIFIYVGLGALVTGWIMIACWLITGQRQSIQCRKQYLKSLLSQQIGWFDCINQAELSSNFSSETIAFQEGVSDKVPLCIYVISMAVSCVIISIIQGWLLTLVLLAILPILLGGAYLYMNTVRLKNQREEKSYSKAGGRAQDTLSAIKTVKALNGQAYESKFYDGYLEEAGKGIIKFGAIIGFSIGIVFFAMFSQFSLGFWFGANCMEATSSCPAEISRQQYTAGRVFTVYFSIFLIGFNLSQLPLSLRKVTEGRIAAGKIFKLIDRLPRVRNPENGIKIQNFKGVIEFDNVTFSYPKEPNKKILDGLSFKTSKNKIAFVGQSGCGKSTIMQLLMRFYDPHSGVITIDGHDLKTIDLTWLRETIGYVGQEPVLFDATIKQNLLFANQKANDQQLENALRKAEALEFVNKLQKRMDTNVGMGGGQISGGQKQRLAIARAILKDPKILLLDQATSALDRKNQKLIQRTLNQISEARLSITIAHRVKTVMSSDEIFVIEKGKVKEHGSFKQLKRFQGMEIENEQEEDLKNNKKEIQDQQLPSQSLIVEKKLTKQELILKQKEELMKIYNKSSFSRVFAYARGNQPLFAIGILVSFIIGGIYPVFSIFLASMLELMLTKKNFMDEANTRALIFLLLGVLWLILSTIQYMVFEYIGEKITRKIRSETFYKLLKLPIYWHEKPQNSVGLLNSRLGVDCKKVKDMTTTSIHGLIQNVSTIVTGLVIALIFEWRTTLVALGLIPFLVIAGAIRMSFRTGSTARVQSVYRSSSNLIVESMINIRTVCSFGQQNIIFNKYCKMMEKPYKLCLKNGILSGFLYGVAQFTLFIVIALIFYIGSLFVQNNNVTIKNMLTAVFALFYSATSAGNNSHILPDLGDCKISAANLFILLDTKDEDEIQVDENSKLIKNKIRGNIQLKDIKFKYDSRSQYLFNGFNLTIPYGEKIAFVGTSGCGKSTILAFLLRFYEPESGTILLDEVNIKDYDIHFLRAQFGVVSQEPVLFNTSFKENIKYNLDKVTDQEIIEAIKQAHSYEFIMEGSDQKSKYQVVKENDKTSNGTSKTGLDRSVGIKGSHISGGQKQRVAIARAILRKPQIMLLDQATSALDSTNQQKVQKCLDEIMQNKSSISVAHRIDTIKNSKMIYVFEKGRIAESGNYQELIGKQGYFYNLEKGTEFK